MRWTRPVVNFALDAFALMVLLAVLWTRIVTYLLVPAPDGTGEVVVLWGWNHADWDCLNFRITMFLAVVILVHLVLHWTWISQFVHHRMQRATGAKRMLDSGTQTIYGVAFMITLFMILGGLLVAAAVMARPLGGSG